MVLSCPSLAARHGAPRAVALHRLRTWPEHPHGTTDAPALDEPRLDTAVQATSGLTSASGLAPDMPNGFASSPAGISLRA
jgi:hypothetical protein